MGQISNNQLFDALNRLERRVETLEQRYQADETKLNEVDGRLDRIEQNIKVASYIFFSVGGLITPIITAVLGSLIQHWLLK